MRTSFIFAMMVLLLLSSARALVTITPLESDVTSYGPGDEPAVAPTGGGGGGTSDTGTAPPVIKPKEITTAPIAEQPSGGGISSEAIPITVFAGALVVALVIAAVKDYGAFKAFKRKRKKREEEEE